MKFVSSRNNFIKKKDKYETKQELGVSGYLDSEKGYMLDFS